ncbi:unnamed protein product [Urochloa humidicola]
MRPVPPTSPTTRRRPPPASPSGGVRVPLGRLLLEEREFRARQRRDGRSESARAWRDQRDDGDEEEDGEASAAAAEEELEGVPPESYCLWAPGGGGQASVPASPLRCRKSGSTGSVLRWHRISDRLVGRSHSDGKEKFVFLTAATAAGPEPPSPGNKAEEQGGGSDNKVRDSGGGAANQLRYYGRGGAGGGSRRRSYLPYKQELVGLFANVSGLRRSYHPF